MEFGKNKIVLNSYDLTARALAISAKIHKDQVRRGMDIPYIVHPVEVAMILQKVGASEEMIGAALLHGVFDNPDIDLSSAIDLIEKGLGEKAHRVIKIINGILGGLENRQNISWKAQKQQIFDYLAKEDTPLEIKMVSCAEELSNIRELVRCYGEGGDSIWEALNQEYSEQKWKYESLVKSLVSLEVYEMYKEFKLLVGELFKE